MLAWTLSLYLDGLIHLTQLGYHKLGSTWKAWRSLKSAQAANSPLESVLVKEQIYISCRNCFVAFLSISFFCFLREKIAKLWYKNLITIPETHHFTYSNCHLWMSTQVAISICPFGSHNFSQHFGYQESILFVTISLWK